MQIIDIGQICNIDRLIWYFVRLSRNYVQICFKRIVDFHDNHT